jgi:hypothetical protein
LQFLAPEGHDNALRSLQSASSEYIAERLASRSHQDMCPRPQEIPRATQQVRGIDPAAERTRQEQQRRAGNNLGIQLLGPVFGAPAAAARALGAPEAVVEKAGQFGGELASAAGVRGARGGARVVEPAPSRPAPALPVAGRPVVTPPVGVKGEMASKAGATVFKSSHYAPRLEAKGINVARAEAQVAKAVNTIRPNMVTNAPVSERMMIDGVLVEYRATLLSNGTGNVGTIFPVKL